MLQFLEYSKHSWVNITDKTLLTSGTVLSHSPRSRAEAELSTTNQREKKHSLQFISSVTIVKKAMQGGKEQQGLGEGQESLFQQQ